MKCIGNYISKVEINNLKYVVFQSHWEMKEVCFLSFTNLTELKFSSN